VLQYAALLVSLQAGGTAALHFVLVFVIVVMCSRSRLCGHVMCGAHAAAHVLQRAGRHASARSYVACISSSSGLSSSTH
jgi:hypothetical protein